MPQTQCLRHFSYRLNNLYLELAFLSCLLDALSNPRKIGAHGPFCCLRISYSPNFVLFQHFSGRFYRLLTLLHRHAHILFPARILWAIYSNHTEIFWLFHAGKNKSPNRVAAQSGDFFMAMWICKFQIDFQVFYSVPYNIFDLPQYPQHVQA